MHLEPACRRLRRVLATVAAVGLVAAAAPAAAQTATIYEEQGQLIRGSRDVATLGPDLFGDDVSLYTGALSFTQTDVSVPGNDSLPVSVGRRMPTGASRIAGGAFGDWELDIPHMKGVFSRRDGWNSGAFGPAAGDIYKRCSQYEAPADAWTENPPLPVGAYEFWFGNHLYVPGAGEQEVLRRRAGGTPAPPEASAPPGTLPSSAMTKAGWAFRCTPGLANGGPGEGFIALSPQGVAYTFDWMVSRNHTSFKTTRYGSGGALAAPVAGRGLEPAVAMGQLLPRSEVWLLPTRVQDRYGNWVRYSYSATNHWELQSIQSSDGRRIDFTYQAGTGRVQTVTVGTRTWRYEYSSTTGTLARLTRVILPDLTSWTFTGDDLRVNPSTLGAPGYCLDPGSATPAARTMTITHPSGASGSFTLTQVRHARSHVVNTCPTEAGAYTNLHPVYYYTRSLTRKAISGPGVPTMAWAYDWDDVLGRGSVSPCGNCPDTSAVTVTHPDGAKTRYTHGIRWRETEGQLQKVEEGWNGSTALRTTTYAYASPSAGPYPDPAGDSFVARGDGVMNSRHTPQQRREITQQGVRFTWQVVLPFDLWARPLVVQKSSTLGHARTETTAYEDNAGLWVMGQVKSRQVTDHVLQANWVAEHHNYSLDTAQRMATQAFGKLKSSYTYHGDGTLKAVFDGAGKGTYYDDYKRGLAQRITHADGHAESATIDDHGLIRTLTNAVHTTTGYAYDDASGRLTMVSPPLGNPTHLHFEKVPYLEFGLPPGHWRQTVHTGTGYTTRYYDALWRVRLSISQDTNAASSTTRAVITRYDAAGRKSFESLPQGGVQTVDDPVPGTATTYDAIGRVLRQELTDGTTRLATVNEYLDGFQRRTTNPRGYVTTHGYQAFDEPSEDHIAWIQAPEQVQVQIDRDVFGKPKSITRSGPYAGSWQSLTRRYVYDDGERLCKTIEPETGATVQDYDDAHNVQWRASGLGLGTLLCDRHNVPGTRKITYHHDLRNRVRQTDFGDGSPGITNTYTADGLLESTRVADVQWTYLHDANRRVVWEQYSWGTIAPGSGWNFIWHFDANHHVAGLTNPWGHYVGYAPNALGEPTEVSGYAHGITHHPNGAVAGYTLANGVRHETTQNWRGLPERMHDTGLLNDVYSYDANGNVTAITDTLTTGADNNNRSMPWYDGLDRLRQAHGRWGTARYDYDALDNLRSSAVGSRTLNHEVDPVTNRLSSLSGSMAVAMAYDVAGNVTSRAGQAFRFDIGNRMSSAVGRASYLYDGHGRRSFTYFADGHMQLQAYGQDGKLRFSYHTAKGHRHYVYLGGKLIAEQGDGDVKTFVHTDGLGSPVVRSTAGASGQMLPGSRTHYEPYGATAAGFNPTGVGFTGHVNDADTGLVYMQQRYYEPLAGRFLSVDPVVTDEKTGGHFNRYVYGENNPYKYVDPDGRAAHIAIGAAAGALMSGYAAFRGTAGMGTMDRIGKVAMAVVGGAAAGALSAAMPLGGAAMATGFLGGLSGSLVGQSVAEPGKMPSLQVAAAQGAVAALGAGAGQAVAAYTGIGLASASSQAVGANVATAVSAGINAAMPEKFGGMRATDSKSGQSGGSKVSEAKPDMPR